jgi:hypothetical protein
LVLKDGGVEHSTPLFDRFDTPGVHRSLQQVLQEREALVSLLLELFSGSFFVRIPQRGFQAASPGYPA